MLDPKETEEVRRLYLENRDFKGTLPHNRRRCVAGNRYFLHPESDSRNNFPNRFVDDNYFDAGLAGNCRSGRVVRGQANFRESPDIHDFYLSELDFDIPADVDYSQQRRISRRGIGIYGVAAVHRQHFRHGREDDKQNGFNVYEYRVFDGQ